MVENGRDLSRCPFDILQRFPPTVSGSPPSCSVSEQDLSLGLPPHRGGGHCRATKGYRCCLTCVRTQLLVSQRYFTTPNPDCDSDVVFSVNVLDVEEQLARPKTAYCYCDPDHYGTCFGSGIPSRHPEGLGRQGSRPI